LLFVALTILLVILGIAALIAYRDAEHDRLIMRVDALWASSLAKLQQGLSDEGEEDSRSPEARSNQQKAQRLFAEARAGYEEMLPLLERLAPKERYPNGHENAPRGMLELGLACYYQGDHAAALGHFRNAIDLIKAQFSRGGARTGSLDDAITAYRKAIQLKPEFAVAHNDLGLVLARQGKLDEAIREHRRAIQLNPEFAVAHTDVGRALTKQGKLDEAIFSYRDAVRIDADFVDAHHQLGHILERQGKRDDAIAEFREAIRIQPNAAELRRDLGCALAARGIAEEAIAQLREAVRIKPDQADFYNDLGFALQGVGDWNGAVESFRRAKALAGPDKEMRLVLDRFRPPDLRDFDLEPIPGSGPGLRSNRRVAGWCRDR
jgi:tetratricopeptide (TPR) repeat protein